MFDTDELAMPMASYSNWTTLTTAIDNKGLDYDALVFRQVYFFTNRTSIHFNWPRSASDELPIVDFTERSARTDDARK